MIDHTEFDMWDVELIQYVLCSANLCEYGTSPRACWFIDEKVADKLISDSEKQYAEKWGR